ncbi:serine hydrolase [Siansivirga zeaxanthinifaciens]|uniref:beta-lactamase n=1 Tax=Siansivirga zeaxanthinifaciens CC-SAMT-1 TaxID=1454006 RepID=A0A0C5WKM0_9FLAO|nr:serine hydrolase [Siansivirga zeaxanthinifaciens]AJR03330.1 hypothetical protein AW14_06340 [Siansivirga zeaxanthinifaciens CC-SAMT-1]
MKFFNKRNKQKYVIAILIVLIGTFIGNSFELKSKLKKHSTYSLKKTNRDYNKLPIEIPEDKFKPLNEFKDAELTKKLEASICKNTSWKNLIDHKKMSVGVVDLSDPENPKFAAINGDEMMYAASLPKIAVLLATEDALEKHEIKLSNDIKTDMRLMISKSNNQATTRLIDLLGYEKIESVLTAPEYNFYDVEKGGGLWVGKRYAASGPTNREPLKNLSHAATVDEVCRFYYLLSYGKLISYDRSKQMLDIMENPDLHHKFVNTLNKIAPNARLFRKSGSWKNWHSDSVLVWDNDRKYILVALLENEGGEQIIRDLVSPVEKALNID